MNPNSGQIHQFETKAELRSAEAEAGVKFIPLKGMPKKSCRKCHGLGHLGRDVTSGQFTPCRCCK